MSDQTDFLIEVPLPPLTEPVLRRDDAATVWHGDALTVLRTMPADSVDAIVTDPPYGLGFMGKEWDALPPGREWAEECLRVLKPGGHLLAFGGTRTWHRLAVAIEDAGFDLRDSIAWMYGSGFPKSMDVSKAIDKAAGATRAPGVEKVYAGGHVQRSNGTDLGVINDDGWQPTKGRTETRPTTKAAEKWEGWGTALKPAFEPIVVARKPLIGTVAANVLQHGTGGLNIDGCRVGREDGDRTEYGRGKHLPHANTTVSLGRFAEVTPYTPHNAGRWPANVALDEAAAAELDEKSGDGRPGARPAVRSGLGYSTAGATGTVGTREELAGGGASRFFYVAKAAAKERPVVDGIAHPTVKPLALMRWLVRLVTPPGGSVVDTFAGSGTTVEAALLEGFNVTAIEMTAEYLPLIDARIDRVATT